MRILTYVSGVITVINGENYFNGVFDKPNFITGNNFYFEPTLNIMDGDILSDDLILEANNYIDNFVFDANKIKEEDVVIEQIVKYYVDNYGNFITTPLDIENLIEIPVPLESNEKWNIEENKKYNYVVVEKASLRIFHSDVIIDDSNADLYLYADLEALDKDVCNVCQIYDLETKKFNIIISELRNKKIASLSNFCLEEIKNQGGDLGNGANSVHNSWLRQELEAEAWLKDNTTLTPFIDNIIIGRNLNEDKETFINKIIEKANNYKNVYGKNLGKLSAKIKEVEIATTKEEILSIIW